MPKRRTGILKNDEKELCRVKLWLPNTYLYMNVKTQLVSGCSVVLKRLKSRKLKYVSPIKSGAVGMNDGGSVFLTPKSGIMESSVVSQKDPLDWLDLFDDLTQLLLGSLITKQYILFSTILDSQNNNIDAKHLLLIAEILGKFSCSQLMKCLKITFDIKNLNSNMKKKLGSVILELIFNEIKKSESYEKKCSCLMDIVENNKLNLLKKIKVLNPHVQKLPVRLLVVEFLLLKRDINAAVHILSHKKVVKVLKTDYISNDDLSMYGVTLLNTCRLIYTMKLPALAFKLALINLTQNVLPPEGEKWGSLALLTILNDCECNVIYLSKLYKKLLKSKIEVPIKLQRAVLIELFRNQFQDINKMFIKSPVYLPFRECLPAKGPIGCKIKVMFMKNWTREEMEMAITWLDNRIQVKKSKPNVECIVTFKTDRRIGSDVIDDSDSGVKARINERFFHHSEKDGRKRLRKIIKSIKLEIALSFN